jgi:cell wall-associated NlpC family hydrolase
MAGDEPPRVGSAAGRAASGAAKQVARAATRKATKRLAQTIVGASSAGTSVAVEAGLRAAKPLLKVLVVVLVITVAVVAFVLVGMTAAAGSAGGSGSTTTCAIADTSVPGDLMPVYDAAAARFGLGPRGGAYLAAINRVETDFGRNVGPSGAGAIGPMQFLPETWAKGHHVGEARVVVAPTTANADGYATDGDEDGVADSANAADAIHAAARYLQANGAPAGWPGAVYAYNHSSEYVSSVTTLADAYAGRCTTFATDVALTNGPKATLGGDGLASAPATAPDFVKAMIGAANQIARKPYVWGGGHQSATPSLVDGYDCSGAVSYVLHAGGLLDHTMVARGFESWGAPVGVGEDGGWVVVYANDGHVWMTIAGLVFDNYGSRDGRSMWSARVVEKVASYVARRPPDART